MTTIIVNNLAGSRVAIDEQRRLTLDLPEAPDELGLITSLQQLAYDLRWNALPDARKRRGQGWVHANEVTVIPLPALADPVEVAVVVLSGRRELIEALISRWVALLPPLGEYRRGQDVVMRDGRGGWLRVYSTPKRGPVTVQRWGLARPVRYAGVEEMRAGEGGDGSSRVRVG